MSSLKKMRDILSRERPRGSSLSEEDVQNLSAGHREFIKNHFRKELKLYRENFLDPMLTQARALRKAGFEDPLAYLINAVRLPRTSLRKELQQFPFPQVPGITCRQVSVSEFVTETLLNETPAPGGCFLPGPGGAITTFQRSTAAEGTLEVGASCGRYPPQSPAGCLFPGANQCEGLGQYNEALATLEAFIDLPAHDFSTVSVELLINLDYVGGDPMTTFPGSYIYTQGGDRNLVINGGTAAWVDIILTLHSANGSISTAKRLLGAWATGLSPQAVIESPNGDSFPLSQTAGVQSTTSRIWVAVDTRAIAFAQGTSNDVGQGMAQIELRDKASAPGQPVDIRMGVYTPPVKIRASQFNAQLCSGAL